MRDKKTVIFPSLLFATFFCLITITGFFQIRVTHKNIEGLLRGEGEIFFKHIKREIDTNLEYLSLLEKSPSIITPNFLNIEVYDEAIVEDLYALVSGTPAAHAGELPFENLTVTDAGGRIVTKKGSLKLPAALVTEFLARKKGALVRMPTKQQHSLIMGVPTYGGIIFFSLSDDELQTLRTKYIVKDILERENKRFNIVGIKIYGPDRRPYITIGGQEKDVFTLTEPLNSKSLPGFTMGILVSKGLAKSISQRTAFSLVFILILLVVSGALSIYAIFFIERKHAKKMETMEKELALQERLVSLGKLASGMAHEIRNPLNAIGLSIQRLRREFVPEDDKRNEYYRFVDIMRAELTRMDRIVEEFLLSTKAHVPFYQENLYTVMEEVIMLLREKADSRGIRIISRMEKDLYIQAQKERLKQAFYNIILNGIEAVRTGETIDISGESRNRTVEISVKDSGVGIREDQIHRIFEYHYTTKDKGMGLGLPISYMIIKDHNGEIKVTSEEGRGTTFLITLPVRQPTERKTEGEKTRKQKDAIMHVKETKEGRYAR